MLKTVFSVFFVWFLLFNHSADGQTPIEVWRNASDLAKSQKWAEVKDYIQPHIFPAPDDTLSPWLIQLYALASLKTGDVTSAIVSGERVKTEYPNWSGIQETNFLLGQIALHQRKISKAVFYWKELPNSFENSMLSTIGRYKVKIPKDSIKVIGAKEEYASSLIIRLLNQQIENQIKSKNSGTLKLGLVLPFELNRKPNQNSESPSNEFYRGISLAAEVMTALDSTLEVYCFDYENSAQKMEQILSNKSLKGLNLLIGPLKFSMLTATEKWANENKVVVINPLSSQILKTNSEFLFSQQPSFSTISKQGFDFISKISLGPKAGIIYGPEKNDSLLAQSYKDYLKKMGREVVLWKKVGKNSAANLTKFLFEAGLDSTSHLFVANSESLVKLQLLGAYSWTSSKYPILICGKWLESPNADYDEYEKHPVFFIDPDFPKIEHPQYKNWESSYISKWGSPPGWIAWKGFDLGISLAKHWYSGGSIDFSSLRSGVELESQLFGKYIFTREASENQFVPIYKLEEKSIKMVWPLSVN